MTSSAHSTPAPDAEATRDSGAKSTEPRAAPSPSLAAQSPQTTTELVASPKPGKCPADDDEKEEGEAYDDGIADNKGEPVIASTSHPAEKPVTTTSDPAEKSANPTSHATEQQSQEDDGWDCQWYDLAQCYYFFNRFTGESTWKNPRVPDSPSTANAATGDGDAAASAQAPAAPPLPTVAGGYIPSIHGDYDTWYAQHGPKEEDEDDQPSAVARLAQVADPSQLLAGVDFSHVAGRPQRPDQGVDRNGYFDVDAAANAHNGKSLKAERSGKRLSKSELKHFREKRKAKREEKKRAWLRD